MSDNTDKHPPGPRSCPIPIAQYPHVMAAHGGGGKLMHELVRRMFVATLKSPELEAEHDGAVLPVSPGRLAFTTDSFVISPLFFPGGDIGSLAVHGTVNDLAMCGARPYVLSAGFILEEGLPMEDLWRIVCSLRDAALEAGVRVVTGDTKVVERGKGDGVFINTSGIGLIDHDLRIGPTSIRGGDVIVLSGDIGRHGIAVMAVRSGLEFERPVTSDSASVAGIVAELLAAGLEIHCMRDLTRGGLSSALVEIAHKARRAVHIEEKQIVVMPEVRGACEMLGFDPLYVANEGRFVVILPAAQAERALAIIRRHPHGRDARIIGTAVADERPIVTMTSRIGTRRMIDMLSGEQLPRIC
ncbi:MAG: hydrogenase expression/formation protein HypE [Gemmatimonadota bacterium]|nr:hydrogenase expression/formation protein HypE [Gemmatimonadota bacterium]